SLFDENLLDLAALRPGLHRHQVHANHVSRKLGSFVRRFRELHTAAFSSAARMNLRLDNHRSTNPLGDLPRLFFCVGDLSTRNPHVVARKNVLGLVLVYFHLPPSRTDFLRMAQTGQFTGWAERLSMCGKLGCNSKW